MRNMKLCRLLGNVSVALSGICECKIFPNNFCSTCQKHRRNIMKHLHVVWGVCIATFSRKVNSFRWEFCEAILQSAHAIAHVSLHFNICFCLNSNLQTTPIIIINIIVMIVVHSFSWIESIKWCIWEVHAKTLFIICHTYLRINIWSQFIDFSSFIFVIIVVVGISAYFRSHVLLRIKCHLSSSYLLVTHYMQHQTT